jgi:hypothetical protein
MEGGSTGATVVRSRTPVRRVLSLLRDRQSVQVWRLRARVGSSPPQDEV